MKYLAIFLLLTLPLFAQQNQQDNRFRLAQTYERAGEVERALELYEQLYRAAPENYAYFNALNNLYVQLKQYGKSIFLIEEQLERQPQNLQLYGFLGKSYYLNEDEEKGFAIWDEAIAQFSERPQTYKVFSSFAIQLRAFDKAIEILEQGDEIADTPLQYGYDLANLYAVQMDYEKATRRYIEILDYQPDQFRTVEVRLLQMGDKENALPAMIDVVEEANDPPKELTTRILAALHAEAGRYDTAFEFQRKIDEMTKGQGIEVFSFAQRMQSGGNYEAAVNAYQFLLSEYPASPYLSQIKLGYAKTLDETVRRRFASESVAWKPVVPLADTGRAAFDRVQDAYREIVKLYPGSEQWAQSLLSIALIEMQFGNFNAAREELEKIIEKPAGNNVPPQALFYLGKAALAEGDTEEAEERFIFLRQSPYNVPELKHKAEYYLGKIDFYRGRFTAAQEKLQRVARMPADDNANDALELSLVVNPNMSDSAQLAGFASGEFALERHDYGEARAQFKDVYANAQNMVLKQLSLLRVAEIAIAESDYADAVALLDSLASMDHSLYGDRALYLQAHTYQYGMGKTEEAVKSLEKILASYPKSLYLNKVRQEIIILRNKVS